MLEIGSKLQQIRQSQGLTLRALAAKADVSPSLLSLIENGKANPSVASLLSIAAALSVPVHEFFPEEVSGEAEGEASGSNGAALEPVAVEKGAPEVIWAGAGGQVNETDLSATRGSVGGEVSRPAPLHPGGVTAGATSTLPASRFVLHPGTRPRIELMGGVVWERLTTGAESGIEFLEVTYEPGGNSGPAMSRHNGREYGVVITGELLLELGFERYLLGPGDSVAFDSSTPHRLSNPGSQRMHAIWVNVAHLP
jgi:transcriptional regulator with XRE-family HTH domain/mannose-6-phosphate isomerase-like protein (cupin superfamily)